MDSYAAMGEKMEWDGEGNSNDDHGKGKSDAEEFKDPDRSQYTDLDGKQVSIGTDVQDLGGWVRVADAEDDGDFVYNLANGEPFRGKKKMGIVYDIEYNLPRGTVLKVWVRISNLDPAVARKKLEGVLYPARDIVFEKLRARDPLRRCPELLQELRLHSAHPCVVGERLDMIGEINGAEDSTIWVGWDVKYIGDDPGPGTVIPRVERAMELKTGGTVVELEYKAEKRAGRRTHYETRVTCLLPIRFIRHSPVALRNAVHEYLKEGYWGPTWKRDIVHEALDFAVRNGEIAARVANALREPEWGADVVS